MEAMNLAAIQTWVETIAQRQTANSAAPGLIPGIYSEKDWIAGDEKKLYLRTQTIRTSSVFFLGVYKGTQYRHLSPHKHRSQLLGIREISEQNVTCESALVDFLEQQTSSSNCRVSDSGP